MADAFVSYARADRNYAKGIVDLLKSDGHDVWWDAEIHAGEIFTKEIKEQLDRSTYVICLWSTRSVESPWVWAEATIAAKQSKLVPVMLEDCEVPIHLSSIQSIRFRGYAGFLEEFHRFAPSGFPPGSYIYQNQPSPPSGPGGAAWKAICALLLVGSIAILWQWSQVQSALAAREASLRALAAENAAAARGLERIREGIVALSAKLSRPDWHLDRADLARELDELLTTTK
jgi:hypothetical protein